MRVLQVENKSFAHSVYSINGGIGREVSIRYLQITEMLSVKQGKHYSMTMSWIQRKLSFTLMRSIITCIRGGRTFKSIE